MKIIKAQAVIALLTFAFVTSAQAISIPVTIYYDRIVFEADLPVKIVDDYSAAGYQSGDRLNILSIDIHSDANMSAVLGEVMYLSDQPDNNFIIHNITTGNSYYCAGCNGSFLMDFTGTSVGTSSGVFGVGFDPGEATVIGNPSALITLGNGVTYNFSLPSSGFFGVTSPLLIASIHIKDIYPDTDQYSLDNLTFGGTPAANNSIPEPASLVLFGVSASLLARQRRVSRN